MLAEREVIPTIARVGMCVCVSGVGLSVITEREKGEETKEESKRKQRKQEKKGYIRTNTRD